MVKAKVIACNIGALVLMAVFALPIMAQAQTCAPRVAPQPCVQPCAQPCPQPCVPACPKPCPIEEVVVEKVEVIDVPCSPCPPCAVLTVPCNQMAIKKVLSDASECKVRRPCAGPCGFVQPNGRWWKAPHMQ